MVAAPVTVQRSSQAWHDPMEVDTALNSTIFGVLRLELFPACGSRMRILRGALALLFAPSPSASNTTCRVLRGNVTLSLPDGSTGRGLGPSPVIRTFFALA